MRGEIHDCWNRIGVQGDGTCGELAQHIHCRNCPVYSAAARQMLHLSRPGEDRQFWTRHISEPRPPPPADTRSALILRCSAEWLALPTNLCVEVAGLRAVRTLPHRRDPALLGLVNVRGELMPCISLSAMLRLQPSSSAGTPRLVIVKGEGESTAVHVDEVHGTHRYAQPELQPLPGTVAASPSPNTCATLRWRERSVGLLEGRAFLSSLDRCLA